MVFSLCQFMALLGFCLWCWGLQFTMQQFWGTNSGPHIHIRYTLDLYVTSRSPYLNDLNFHLFRFALGIPLDLFSPFFYSSFYLSSSWAVILFKGIGGPSLFPYCMLSSPGHFHWLCDSLTAHLFPQILSS